VYSVDPIFNVSVPQSCPGVPSEVLQPRNTWSDPAAYDAQAHRLARMFGDNFKSFEAEAAPDVVAAGPKAF
jgi:phosphoenolpyruvate carboxykinase (ATP)